MRLRRALLASLGLGGWGLALALAERRWALRPVTRPRLRRALGNAAVASTGFAVLVAGYVGIILPALRRSAPSRLPPALQFLILDYTLWLWHRANHEAPFLWRFHAAHHADPDLDLSTAIRFHAGEMALSVPLRVLQARCLGVAPDVLLAWEAATMAAILFHHSNLRLPRALDAAARAVFVTPRLHGIHHSIVDEDRAHNFGTVFTFWDRLHGRYLAGTPNRRLVIGIPELPERPALSAAASLAFPFRRAT